MKSHVLLLFVIECALGSEERAILQILSRCHQERIVKVLNECSLIFQFARDSRALVFPDPHIDVVQIVQIDCKKNRLLFGSLSSCRFCLKILLLIALAA